MRHRDEEVEQPMRRLFPHTVLIRNAAVSGGWMQGRAAADRGNLGLSGTLQDGTA